MFGSVIVNFLSQSVGRIITLFLSLATTALLARYFRTEGYGIFTFITAFVLLFGTIADWGTQIISVRQASQEKDKQTVFGTIFLFRFVLALIVFLLFHLTIRISPNWQEYTVPLSIASLVLLALSLKTSAVVVLHTHLNFKAIATIDVVSSLFFFLFTVVLIVLKGTLVDLMWVWFFATLISAIVGILYIFSKRQITLSIDKNIAQKILREAIPAGTLFLLFYIYNRIDTIILQYYQGSNAVGIYGLPYKIHDNLVLGAAFLMNALFPILAKDFKSENLVKVKEDFKNAFNLLLGMGIVICFVSFITSSLIINVLGGGEFSESTGVFRILLFATFLAYINHLNGYSLIAFGKQKISLVIASISLTVNVILNLIFVPLYSFYAAALITIATEFVVLLLSTIVIKKIFGQLPVFVDFVKTWTSLLRYGGLLKKSKQSLYE